MKDDYYLKTSRDAVYVYSFNDWHLGTLTCNIQYIKVLLKEIDDLKGTVIIYILGDIFECADARVGNSPFKQIWSVNKQLREARKLIGKLARKPNVDVRYATAGNHEARWKKNDFDPMEEFCETLHVNYAADSDMDLKFVRDCNTYVASSNFIDKIYINDKPLKIFGRHGNGSAKRLDLAMAKQVRETIFKSADIFLEGHNHRCFGYSQTVQTSYDEGNMKRRYYGFGGHMLGYSESYAAETGLDILPEAYLRLTIKDIDGKLQIESKDYPIDRYRPDLFKVFP